MALSLAASNRREKRVSVECLISDVDNDWVKVSYTDKKGVSKIKIIRLESVYDIKLL